jgi:hypothetical protein
MLNTVEIHTCRTSLENGREYIYIYYLTESTKDIAIEDLEVSVSSYGIGIIREEMFEGRIIDTFEDRFDSVSPIKSKVMSLIDFLIDNEVSPLHLIDVIGESVDNWVTDYEIEAISKLSINAMA